MMAFKRPNGQKESPSDPRVLLVNNMLREGFDFNSISVVGISRILQTDGPAFEQFLGRCVRIVRGGKEPKGLTAKFVWHVYDNLQGQFDTYKQDRKVM